MLLTFGDLNLTGLTSHLVNSLNNNNNNETTNLKEIPLFEQFQSKTLIEAFNTRFITPTNINEIISLCDYLLLDNTALFLRNNVEYPHNQEVYVLNDYHLKHFTGLFPEFDP